MKHESLTCKIREKSPRKFKTLAQCHSTRKWQRREQIPAFSIAHSVWCSPQQLPSMVLFWTPVVAFLGTLQNHLEKECSQAWFDQTWLWKERGKRLELRAPTPFHSGHLKLLSCLLIGPTLSHISGHGDVPWPRLLTDSCPFICGWCVATMGCR